MMVSSQPEGRTTETTTRDKVRLVLTPGPQYRLGLFGVLMGAAALVLFSIVPWSTSDPNGRTYILAFIGIIWLNFWIYWAYRRVDSVFEVDGEDVRFIHGGKVRRSMAWTQVGAVHWGPMRRAGRPDNVHITFFNREGRIAIQVLGRFYGTPPDDTRKCALVVADLAKAHAVPLKEKLVYF